MSRVPETPKLHAAQYRWIASHLGATYGHYLKHGKYAEAEAIHGLACAMVADMQAANEKFNKKKFYAACGMEG